MPEVTIRRGDRQHLDQLEPLWLAVHQQHQISMPNLGPYVDDSRTWSHRWALYASLFDRYDPCLLLARVHDQLIGYGLAYAIPAQDTWLADTWATGTVIGEIESLSVLPNHRGRGVGTRLLNGLHRHLAEAGVRDIILGVLPGNTDAQRLYAHHGYTPTGPTCPASTAAHPTTLRSTSTAQESAGKVACACVRRGTPSWHAASLFGGA